MSNGEYPVEPEVALAIERLRRDLGERLTRLEAKVDGLSASASAPSPAPGGATRGAVVGAAGAGLGLGLVEGLRRLFS